MNSPLCEDRSIYFGGGILRENAHGLAADMREDAIRRIKSSFTFCINECIIS